MIKSWKRPLAMLASALVVVAGGTLTAGPAGAASSTFDPIADTTGLTLDPGTSLTDYAAWTKAVESRGVVTVLNANALLDRKGWSGVVGLSSSAGCHDEPELATALSPSGFCWDHGDDISDSYTTAGGWTPQGITGSYDAQPTGTWADGSVQHTAYMASWHFDANMQASDPAARQPGLFTRVTLVNADGGQINYNHILLVKPNSSGNFSAVTSTHADGMVWYGNSLFVANGHELQVYSLNHIWQVGSNQNYTGIINGVSSAHYSNYALPMVGDYYTTSGSCSVATGTAPCLNSLSLDRTGQDGLVSAEYSGAPGGRVIRWPLNYQTALPLVNGANGTTVATLAYASPVLHMQGAATNGTNWYLSGDCATPDPDPNDAAGTSYSCIWKAAPQQTPGVFTESPVMTQNLGYSPATNRIWGINERINSTVGQRVVFSINP